MLTRPVVLDFVSHLGQSAGPNHGVAGGVAPAHLDPAQAGWRGDNGTAVGNHQTGRSRRTTITPVGHLDLETQRAKPPISSDQCICQSRPIT